MIKQFSLDNKSYGMNPMSKTIEGLPKERMIETPVMEEPSKWG